jgi:acetyl esterase/lipase
LGSTQLGDPKLDRTLTLGNSRDPLANRLYADLTGLPPIYIQAGGDETLVDDSRRFAAQARGAGPRSG